MHKNWRIGFVILTLWTLTGCTSPVQPSEVNTDTNQVSVLGEQGGVAEQVDLSGIKEFLLAQTVELKSATNELKNHSDQYYQLAKNVDFDYARLWDEKQTEVVRTIEAARTAWIVASPLYEKMEGIVAGTPSLSEFDVILDAGTNGEEGADGAVPFDLTLPDGRVLAKPGNLFGVSESTLWGTDASYLISEVEADFNGNGTLEFGESLPDANVLIASAEALDRYASDLHNASQSWSPTVTDAFTALVTMIPTMNEYFSSWRDSRFVAGESSTQRDFVAISRLADMQDILGGLQVVYQNVKPMIAKLDKAQSEQVAQQLGGLHAFVAGVYEQEQGGKRFSPEDAELLGAEAQNRATAVTGQISQFAGLLGVELP